MQTSRHALALAVLLTAAGHAMAATVDIGGLTLSTGPIFSVTSIYENVVSAPGQELRGVGEVTQINGADVSTLCSGCELTYQFGGYVVSSISPTDIKFTGGWINFYLGSGADNDFNPFASSGSAADVAAATNGSLFLTLSGHAIDAAGNTFSGTGTNIGTTSPAGFGAGLADVNMAGGGLANAFFDTNAITATFGGNADFQLGSSFSSLLLPHPLECPTGPECVAGSADIRGVVAVPEPQTYALLLAGLGVVGVVARRRRS
jgi:hypothetical protein